MLLAPYVSGEDARIEPDLVLVGLSQLASALSDDGRDVADFADCRSLLRVMPDLLDFPKVRLRSRRS